MYSFNNMGISSIYIYIYIYIYIHIHVIFLWQEWLTHLSKAKHMILISNVNVAFLFVGYVCGDWKYFMA